MEVERGQDGRPVVRALVISGAPMAGVMLANLLTRGFSWGDLGAVAVIWAFFFAVLLFFYSRRDRFGRR